MNIIAEYQGLLGLGIKWDSQLGPGRWKLVNHNSVQTGRSEDVP